MKNILFAALAALTLSATMIPPAFAGYYRHQGSYDNTGHGPKQTYQGGDGSS